MHQGVEGNAGKSHSLALVVAAGLLALGLIIGGFLVCAGLAGIFRR